MVSRTSIFLKILRVSHYVVLLSYFSLFFGFKLLKNSRLREKYTNALNTFYILGVSIVLLSVRFPSVLFDISNPKYRNDTSALIFSAGLIVLSTVSYQNIVDLWKVITLSDFS